jgi:ribosome-binding factor A
MPREFARHLRVGAELKRVLNELLQDEVKDPRLHDVRVSEVDLSGDLGVARIYYSTLDPAADTKPIDAALLKAAAFMRSRIAREIQLRRVPELRFAHDLRAQQGQRISALLDESAAAEPGKPSAED